MVKVLVSACLLGERVRYHGGDAASPNRVLDRWAREGRLVSACPEVAGGLPVPRLPAEIVGEGGHAVLTRAASVKDATGADVTAAFLQGALRALEAAVAAGARLAVLKDGSPSCGVTYIHDGSFRGRRRPGQGVTSALLSRAGIRVFSESQWDDADAYIRALEGQVQE